MILTELRARLRSVAWQLLCIALAVLLVVSLVRTLTAERQRDAAKLAAAEAIAETQSIRAQAATQAADASESAREREHLATVANTRLTDALQDAHQAGSAERAAADRRLREQAAAARAAHASTSAGGGAASAASAGDAPTLACLPDAARSDLVGLAADADDDVRDLTALQRYVAEVVPLCAATVAHD